MEINEVKAAVLLKGADQIAILTHRNPDGDTLGSGIALYLALKSLGKQATVMCPDPIPAKFGILYRDIIFETFEPSLYVAVDIASPQLLGNLSDLAGKTALCIDHHPSNTGYADYTLLDTKAAATCEIIFSIIEALGVPIEDRIAKAVYTGIITDTGCFQFSNTTARTHILAAKLMETGIQTEVLNRMFFSTKSKARLEIERLALDTLEYYAEDRIALVMITNQMRIKTGASEEDLDGLTPLTRQIENVEIGLTLRERENGEVRVSVRTNSVINASEICAEFGGGGHMRAGGCTLEGSILEVKPRIVAAAVRYLNQSMIGGAGCA